MTTIIAIEHPEGVTLGFDSKVSYGWGTGADCELPKVFSNGEVIFGVCGDVLDLNIFRYAELPALHEYEWDIDRWFTTALVPALHEALAARHAVEYRNSKVSTGGSTLIVIRGRVYKLHSDGSWTRHTNNRYAVGSGADFALGALAADASVRQALEIAASLDGGTGYRLTVLQNTEILEGITA